MAKIKEKITDISGSNNLIQYRLKEILDHRFNYTAPIRNYTTKNEIVELTINHTITPAIKYNIETNDIIVVIKIRAYIKETDETIVEAENAFIYHAIDLKKFLEYNQDKKTWKFHDVKNEALITTLIGISLSTMRGILYERSKGTVLERAPIPIMNPATFIKSQGLEANK